MHWIACSAQAFWFWGANTGEGLIYYFPSQPCQKTPQQRRYHGHHDSVWLYRKIGCKATVWIEPYTWPILLHLEKLGSWPPKKRPDASSLKMEPPWKRQFCDSCPYLVGTHPGVLQMNWSVETKSPTLYWSIVIASSQYLISHVHETFGVLVLACGKTGMTRRNNTISSQSKTWLGNGMKKHLIAIRLHIIPPTHHLLDARHDYAPCPMPMEKFLLRCR